MATATAEKAARTVKPPKVKDQPLFIGGKWQDSVSGKTFPTINPATIETRPSRLLYTTVKYSSR